MRRLSPSTLSALPGDVARPPYDPTNLDETVAHIGVGAFHRAHQAVYTDIANARADRPAGVVGLSLRSPTMAEALNPQQGLFTVAESDGPNETLRVIGNLTRIITVPERPETAFAALTSPKLTTVTLTITEKGYGLDPASGELITTDGDVAQDLINPRRPRSAIGFLVEVLRQRRAARSGGLTAISCDNVPENGRRLGSSVLQFAQIVDPDLARWISDEAAFPQTMVDRIVPAATPQVLDDAAQRLGLRDEGHVKTEPFMQWVIEDRFAGPRPAWERAGALVVDDVAPYETAKLRLLNGAHSAMAYLGYLSGCSYVHEVMAQPELSRFVGALMEQAIAPTLPELPDMPIAVYIHLLRDRFANSALSHRTWQIAMDGSQKLPQRILNTIRDQLAADQPIDRLALVVAAWIRYAAGIDEQGDPIDVRDPLSDDFRSIAQQCLGNLQALLDGFLGLKAVFGEDLPGDPTFTSAVRTQLDKLHADGARAAAAALT